MRSRLDMFVIRRVLVVDPVGTSNDFGNELGHEEFDVKFDSVDNSEELNVAVDSCVSSYRLESVLSVVHRVTYSYWFGRLSIPMSNESITTETITIHKFNRNSELYLVKPLAMSLDRTRCRK